MNYPRENEEILNKMLINPSELAFFWYKGSRKHKKTFRRHWAGQMNFAH